MRINDRQIAHFAKTSQRVDKQGWLYKKGVIINQSYKKRWFRLKGNLLFYYKSDVDSEPIGVIVLERCRVETCVKFEGDLYSFKVLFDAPANTPSRDYHLGTESEEEMMAWIKAISEAPIEYLLAVISDLKRRVELAEAEAEAEAAAAEAAQSDVVKDESESTSGRDGHLLSSASSLPDGVSNMSITSADFSTPLSSPGGAAVFLSDSTIDDTSTDKQGKTTNTDTPIGNILEEIPSHEIQTNGDDGDVSCDFFAPTNDTGEGEIQTTTINGDIQS